jgi:hypothetical protein
VTPLGQPLLRTFTLRNVGNEPLTVRDLDLPAGFAVVRRIVINPDGTETPVGTPVEMVEFMPLSEFNRSRFPAVLAPDQEFALQVALRAERGGEFAGELVFANDDADENPFNFAIVGTVGSEAVPVLELRDATGQVLRADDSVRLRTAAVGNQTRRTLVVRNIGTDTLELDIAALQASLAGTPFSLAEPLPAGALEPQDLTTLTLIFAPSSQGSRELALPLSSNAPDSPLALTLRAQAVRFDVVVNSEADFADTIITPFQGDDNGADGGADGAGNSDNVPVLGASIRFDEGVQTTQVSTCQRPDSLQQVDVRVDQVTASGRVPVTGLDGITGLVEINAVHDIDQDGQFNPSRDEILGSLEQLDPQGRGTFAGLDAVVDDARELSLLITYTFADNAPDNAPEGATDDDTGARLPTAWFWALALPWLWTPLRAKRRWLLLGLLLLLTACQSNTTTPAVPGSNGDGATTGTYQAFLFGAVAETNCEDVEANFPEGEIAGGLVTVNNSQ